MGDRGNIVIEKDKSGLFPAPVYFYTHWSGSDLKETLKDALVRGKARWNDPSYLARVIFCEMVGDNDGVTGYGISTAIGDNGHNLLCVNIDEKKVIERDRRTNEPVKEWSFEDYVNVCFDCD